MSAKKIELTPEQLKTLKLFSYYCRGYGAKEVEMRFWFQNGVLDWSDNSWSSPQLRKSIESYGSIDNLIETIINENELYFMGEDSYNTLNITFNINVVSKIMYIVAEEEAFGYEDSGDEFYSDDNNDLLLFFDEMKSRSMISGTVEFSGGGDEGFINSTIKLNDDTSEDIPKGIWNFLYRALEEHQGGWEIDDGSQGTFTFEFEEDKVYLEFELNTREKHMVDTSYEIPF